MTLKEVLITHLTSIVIITSRNYLMDHQLEHGYYQIIENVHGIEYMYFKLNNVRWDRDKYSFGSDS